MPTWKDVAQENFDAAELLIDDKKYRSATSRVYYAVFSALTYELLQRGDGIDFGPGRNTPSHARVSELIDQHLSHFTPERRSNLIRAVADPYRDRLAADYSSQRVDRVSGLEALRLANLALRYLGVKP